MVLLAPAFVLGLGWERLIWKALLFVFPQAARFRDPHT